MMAALLRRPDIWRRWQVLVFLSWLFVGACSLFVAVGLDIALTLRHIMISCRDTCVPLFRAVNTGGGAGPVCS
jgi:hypothetical protein